MNEEKEKSGLTLGDVFRILREHIIMIIICLFLGVGGGVAIRLVSPVEYQASMKVYLNDSNYDPDSTQGSQEIIDGLRIINTFIDYITDKPVAEKAVEFMEDENFEINYNAILAGLDASTNSENTLCCTVYFTSNQLDARETATVLENVILASQFVSENGAFNLFKDKISTAYENSLLGNGDCAETTEVSKGYVFYGAIGLAIGLVAGIAYAFIRELCNNTIRKHDDIELKYGLKVIGSIPEITEENVNEK